MGLAPIQRRFQLTSISPGARLCLLTRFLGVRHATTRFLLAQPQRGVRSYENRVSFSYLSDLPLQQLLATLSRLRSEEHTSELQSLRHLVCRLLLEKKKTIY